MSCWCDEIENYVCFYCEETKPPKEPEILKAYLRLVINGKFNVKNESHMQLMNLVNSNGDDIENLTIDEVRQLK